MLAKNSYPETTSSTFCKPGGNTRSVFFRRASVSQCPWRCARLIPWCSSSCKGNTTNHKVDASRPALKLVSSFQAKPFSIWKIFRQLPGIGVTIVALWQPKSKD